MNEHKLLPKYISLLNSIGISEAGMVDLVNFPKHETLFKPGDSCEMFLIVISGKVRVELTTKNGRELTLYNISNGQNCLLTTSALLNGEKYFTRGITESEVSALAMPAEKFQQTLATNAVFAKYVLEGFSSRISSIVRLVDRMASRDVNASIAMYLLENEQNSTVNITQKNLAMEVGTAREVVSRKLSEMQEKGILERQSSLIKILDSAALKKLIT